MYFPFRQYSVVYDCLSRGYNSLHKKMELEALLLCCGAAATFTIYCKMFVSFKYPNSFLQNGKLRLCAGIYTVVSGIGFESTPQ